MGGRACTPFESRLRQAPAVPCVAMCGRVLGRYLRVLSPAGSDLVRFQPRESYGWVFPLVMGRTYRLVFVSVAEFQVGSPPPPMVRVIVIDGMILWGAFIP
jgi:hypothetical protein